MLNYIWSGLIAVSVLCALFMGNTADISNALIVSLNVKNVTRLNVEVVADIL